MKNGYVKLYEEFIDDDYEMQRIMKQLEKRAYHWFSKGALSKDAQLVEIEASTTAIATRKTLIINFNDNEFYYILKIRINIEEMGKCELDLEKYKPNSDSTGTKKTKEELEFIDDIHLTGENKVDINDIKGEFILDKIAELNGKSKNPDKNEIETPKEEEKTETPPPAEGGTPPAQGGTPPAQGAPPQGGGSPPPPSQGAPPQGGGTPPAL